jgi:hypothetical protein
MLLTAPTGFVLSQRAMQLGRVLAPVTAVISSVDPVVAVAIGVVALGERIDRSHVRSRPPRVLIRYGR